MRNYHHPMSELSFDRKARIERVILVRRAKRESQRKHEWIGLMAFMGIAGIALLLAIWIALQSEWRPGTQDEVAAQYRAVRHKAEDWE